MPFPPGQSGNPATQFPPGNNANPTGRPPGPNRGTELRKLMDLKARYKGPDGEDIDGTIEGMMSMAMVAAASMGDVNAYKAIMDDVYGKLTDKVETTTTRKITRKIGGRSPAEPEVPTEAPAEAPADETGT